MGISVSKGASDEERAVLARATIIEDGLMGLMSVRAELDCTYSWDLLGSDRNSPGDC